MSEICPSVLPLLALCVGIAWHLVESIVGGDGWGVGVWGGSTRTLLPKEWLMVESLHWKNVAEFSLIVTAPEDCTHFYTTPRRSGHILRTACHFK